MKTIGLIGGMSYISTMEYYRIINEVVCEYMGGLHSAKCNIMSVDFAKIVGLQEKGRWDKISRIIISAAQKLEEVGTDFIVLCTNTLQVHHPISYLQRHKQQYQKVFSLLNSLLLVPSFFAHDQRLPFHLQHLLFEMT